MKSKVCGELVFVRSLFTFGIPYFDAGSPGWACSKQAVFNIRVRYMNKGAKAPRLLHLPAGDRTDKEGRS